MMLKKDVSYAMASVKRKSLREYNVNFFLLKYDSMDSQTCLSGVAIFGNSDKNCAAYFYEINIFSCCFCWQIKAKQYKAMALTNGKFF